MINQPKHKELGLVNEIIERLEPSQLIVHNDEVNTFDWVIESLVEICQHSWEQAEQCSLLIHYKGKYAVKIGAYTDINPMRVALVDRGLSATIETF